MHTKSNVFLGLLVLSVLLAGSGAKSHLHAFNLLRPGKVFNLTLGSELGDGQGSKECMYGGGEGGEYRGVAGFDPNYGRVSKGCRVVGVGRVAFYDARWRRGFFLAF
jgi:hypothetical protein